jgi:glucose/arabinose dehydrogenase
MHVRVVVAPAAGVLATVVMLAALTLPGAAEQTRAPPRTTKQLFKVETFAKGLVHPWSLAFLPDGRLLVTERPGRLRVVGKDGQLSAPIANVPEVQATGQGGLLDVTLSPDFASSTLVFLSFAEPRGRGLAGTAVARARLVLEGDGGRLDDVKVIFRQEPGTGGGRHFGSRLVFAPDGNLFVTVGERGDQEKAQDLGTHYGKVVRVRPDGSLPPDNPFAGKAGAQPEIWSYGHRNIQSAALNPVTSKLWTIEHAARGGDELNIPLAGKNYGWPVITYGRDYSGAKIGEGTAKAGMEQPVYYWDPSIAPSGMAFYTGELFPEWKGNLFVGALAGAAVHRLVLDGDSVVGEQVLLRNLDERIRDVRAGPDGALWLSRTTRRAACCGLFRGPIHHPGRSGASRRRAAVRKDLVRGRSASEILDTACGSGSGMTVEVVTVATGVTGEPTAPGRRRGGAVRRKRLRLLARSQPASSERCHSSPRLTPVRNRQCWCSGSAAHCPGRRGMLWISTA